MADPILNAYEVADRQGWFIVGAYRRAATPRWGTSVPTAVCLMGNLDVKNGVQKDSWRVAEIRADQPEFSEGWYSDNRKAAYDRWSERVARAAEDIEIYYGLKEAGR
jgi:hypothetical protein